jgi:uncharacterized membrane protein
MKYSETTRSAARGASSRWTPSAIATTVGLLVVLAIGIGFLIHYAAPYFRFDPNQFGHFWPQRVRLILHLCGGIPALVFGPWQLWTGLRQKALRVHRWTGRIYLAGVVAGSAGAFLMGGSAEPRGFGVALMVLGAAWLASTAVAYAAILRRNVKLHKEWMVRSYLITFAFVIFRVMNDGLPGVTAQLGSSPLDALANITWLSWVVPLGVYELLLQGRRLWRARPTEKAITSAD